MDGNTNDLPATRETRREYLELQSHLRIQDYGLDQRVPTGSHTEETLRDPSQPQPSSLTEHKGNEKAEGNHEFLSGFRLVAVLVAVTLVVFLLLLDISIISTALPEITSAFNSVSDAGWYGGAYQLASASLQPLTGKFYSNFNSKRTFMFFFFVFELGSLICATAVSSSMFIAGRTIAGLGSSGLFNGGVTILAGAVALEKRPVYTGIMLGIGEMGVVCGPLIGGAFTQYASWRWCFYLNLPIGGLCALLLVFTPIPDIHPKPRLSLHVVRKIIPTLDLFGFALFAPAAVMFLLALQFGGNDYAWDSSVIIGLFCGAGVAAVLFCLWEFRIGDRAMIPAAMLKNPIVGFSLLHVAFMMSTVSVPSYYLPTYFQAVRGTGAVMSGVDMLPSILSQLIFVVLSGAGVKAFGYYLPWAVASGAICAVGSGLLSLLSPTTSTAKWIGYQILAGAGRGAGVQMGMVATQNAVGDSQLPVAMAMLIFAQNFSGATFVVIATTIFDQSLISEIPRLAPSVSVQAALKAGTSASAVRGLLPVGSSELEGLLLAYSTGIDRIFYLVAALAVAGFAVAWGLGWKDLRPDKKPARVEP